jgi:hypothetical protein
MNREVADFFEIHYEKSKEMITAHERKIACVQGGQYATREYHGDSRRRIETISFVGGAA